jgi:hypothetical protein
MGRNAKRLGISNATLRQARKAARTRDAEATAIAQVVYNIVVETRGDTQIPQTLNAPLLAACQAVAPAILRQFPLLLEGREIEEAVADVAGYLQDAFLSISILSFDPGHYEKWRTERPFSAQPPEPGGTDDAGAETPPADGGAGDGDTDALRSLRVDAGIESREGDDHDGAQRPGDGGADGGTPAARTTEDRQAEAAADSRDAEREPEADAGDADAP